jgi:hypothetical protein
MPAVLCRIFGSRKVWIALSAVAGVVVTLVGADPAKWTPLITSIVTLAGRGDRCDRVRGRAAEGLDGGHGTRRAGREAFPPVLNALAWLLLPAGGGNTAGVRRVRLAHRVPGGGLRRGGPRDVRRRRPGVQPVRDRRPEAQSGRRRSGGCARWPPGGSASSRPRKTRRRPSRPCSRSSRCPRGRRRTPVPEQGPCPADVRLSPVDRPAPAGAVTRHPRIIRGVPGVGTALA